MEYRVLTVGREFGSGGGDIARRLAMLLDWKLLDNTLVTQIAQAAQLDPALVRRYDERVDTWLHRVTRASLWSGGFEAVAEPPAGAIFDAEAMVELTVGLIREAHSQGNCVIVGRGGQCVLRGKRDVFHLFVYAPLAERIVRARTRADAPRDVESWVREMDLTRARYVRHHFGCDWGTPHLYNLLIDSSLGGEAVSEAVLAAMGAR